MNIISHFVNVLVHRTFNSELNLDTTTCDFSDPNLVLSFASLGKAVASVDFGEASLIEDAGVKSQVKGLLQQKTGQIKSINWLLFNPGAVEIGQEGEDWEFRGQAEQAISSVRSQYYSFTISGKTGQIVYKLTNPQAVADVADFEETYEFATSSKKLNCKPGNIQCGGKCQNGGFNCYVGMTPAQKKATQAAARAAKKTIAAKKEIAKKADKKLGKADKDKENLQKVLNDDRLMSQVYAGGIPDRLKFLAKKLDDKTTITSDSVRGSMNDLVAASKGDSSFAKAADYVISSTWRLLPKDQKDEFALNTPSMFRGNNDAQLGSKTLSVKKKIEDLERKHTKEKYKLLDLLEEAESKNNSAKVSRIETELEKYNNLNERFQ